MTTDTPDILFKKRHDSRVVLVCVFSFFLTFICVDAFMAAVAISTQTGTVIKNPYETGLSYNQVLGAAESQKKLGWTGIATIENHKIIFHLNDATGQPITGAIGHVVFFRPVQEKNDFTLPLTPGAPGIYTVDIPKTTIGNWQIRIYIQKGGAVFTHHQDFTL